MGENVKGGKGEGEERPLKDKLYISSKQNYF